MFPTTIFAQLGIVALVFAFSFALWKGDSAERIGGGVNLAAGLFAMLIHPFVSADLEPIFQLVADAILAGGFLFLAIRFASLWLGVAMLLQAVQFSLHAYYMVDEVAPNLLFWRVNNGDSWAIILCIVGGTIVSWRRRLKKEQMEADKATAEASRG